METANRRITKDGNATLYLFYKIERIHFFDIRNSVFDIRYSLFYKSAMPKSLFLLK